MAEPHGVVTGVTRGEQRARARRRRLRRGASPRARCGACSSTPKRGRGADGIRLARVDGGDVVVGAAPAVEERRRRRAPRGASSTASRGSSLTHDHVRPSESSTIRFPMNAAARARRYGAPPTSCSAPVGHPTTSTPGGSGTAGPTDAGRHRIGRIAPGVPMATVTWSMIPHGAPTTWFSASWHRAASRKRVDAVGAQRAARSRPRARRSTTRRPTAGRRTTP